MRKQSNYGDDLHLRMRSGGSRQWGFIHKRTGTVGVDVADICRFVPPRSEADITRDYARCASGLAAGTMRPANERRQETPSQKILILISPCKNGY